MLLLGFEYYLINEFLIDITQVSTMEYFTLSLLLLIIPGMILLYCRKWINKHATAKLNQDKLELSYDGKTQLIEFTDITKVKVDHFNGVLLRITTQSHKVKFASNHLTTSTTELREFSKDLKGALENFNSSNVESKVQIPKNIFEKKLGLYFLIGTSFIMAISVIYLYLTGKSLTGPLISSFGVLSALWTAYLIQNK